MIKHIALLYNIKAGKGRAASVTAKLREVLDLRKILYSCFDDYWPQQLEGYTDVFLVGGDGTLNYFINRYPDVRLPISLFRGGSGNDFAWKLYGDKSIHECLELALGQEAKSVDAGICNGRLFLNGVGIGFDGAIVKSMGAKRRFSAGHLAYLLTVIKHVLFYKEAETKISFDSNCITDRFFMLTIANGSRYGGGFLVAPGAEVNDSLFDTIAIRKVAPLLRVVYLPKVQKGNHLKLPFVSSFKTSHIKICSQNPLPAHYDGEFLEASEFDISLLPSKFLFRY